jgi:hypothetical protein
MGTCLWKGNPLYPFMFLITGEGLTVMLNALDESGLFTRYKFCHSANLHIFHLQFVHDTFILRKSWENINLIMFEIIYGLKVNFYKCLFGCCECG